MYPYLPNFYFSLENKAHVGETIQAFFKRLGYPHVAWSDRIDRESGQWLDRQRVDCLCAIMPVTRRNIILDITTDKIYHEGQEVLFIAFKKAEDCFIFKLAYGFS